jgi:hypothetical protein
LTKRKLANQNWYIAHKKVSKRDAKRDGVQHVKLTKVQKTYNNHVYSVRARVKDPFGQMKAMFACLREPWKEDMNQQDYLVMYAVGIHNKRVR